MGFSSGGGGSNPISPFDFSGLTTSQLLYFNGTNWVPLALASVAPLTTQDDLYVGGAAGVAARLAKGADRTVLTVDPSTHHIVWAAASPVTTQDDIIVGGGSGVLARLAKGADGQVLTVDPSTHHLLWANPGPITTQDDIIVGGGSGVPARLAKGADSQVLTIDPATHHIVWANSASGFSNPMTTAGDLILGDTGGAAIRIAKGADSTVLTVDPATHLPVWAAPAGGGGSSYPPGSRLIPPGSPNAKDDEFDGTTLVTWTAFGTWAATDVDTTRDNHLYARASGTGSTLCGKVQAIPATPFDIYLNVAGHTGRQNFMRGGGIVLLPAGAISGASVPVYVGGVYNNGWGAGRITYASLSSFGSQSTTVTPVDPIFFWVHVIDTTHIDAYYSLDGYAWRPLELNYNLPWTLGLMGLASSEEASGGVDTYFDFFRVV